MLQICVVDGKVGCEHGCRDFTTVGTVADECVDQTGTFGWLVFELEGERYLLSFRC